MGGIGEGLRQQVLMKSSLQAMPLAAASELCRVMLAAEPPSGTGARPLAGAWLASIPFSSRLLVRPSGCCGCGPCSSSPCSLVLQATALVVKATQVPPIHLPCQQLHTSFRLNNVTAVKTA